MHSVQTQVDEEIAKIISQEGIGGLDPLSEWQSLVRQEIDLTVELRGLEQKEELIEANIQKFHTEHPELISKEVELMQLHRKARQYEETHGFLMKSRADIQILRQMQTSELSVITKAFPPEAPIKPKKKMTLILGAVLGVMLGMGGAFFLEYMDNSLRKKEDIERWLGLPMVGAIPQIPLAKNKEKITPTSTNISDETSPAESVEEESPYLTLDSPTQSTQSNAQTEKSTKRKHRKSYYKQIDSLVLRSLSYLSRNFSESYLSLMTAIQFAEVDAPITTILVTSSVPGEGKILTVANLAATYAQNGKKTLLVDLDLRCPRQHIIFSQEIKGARIFELFCPACFTRGGIGEWTHSGRNQYT